VQCTKILSDFEFGVKGQTSRSPWTKTRLALPTPPGAYEWYAQTACSREDAVDRGRWKKLIKDWMVGGWLFLLVPAHPGSPGQRAVKRLLLLLFSAMSYILECSLVSWHAVFFWAACYSIVSHTRELASEKWTVCGFVDFLQWKAEQEDSSSSSFVKARQDRKLRSGGLARTYYCHRSGHYRHRGRNVRHMKIQGSCKIGSVCPASMFVKITESGMCFYHLSALIHCVTKKCPPFYFSNNSVYVTSGGNLTSVACTFAHLTCIL